MKKSCLFAGSYGRNREKGREKSGKIDLWYIPGEHMFTSLRSNENNVPHGKMSYKLGHEVIISILIGKISIFKWKVLLEMHPKQKPLLLSLPSFFI